MTEYERLQIMLDMYVADYLAAATQAEENTILKAMASIEKTMSEMTLQMAMSVA